MKILFSLLTLSLLNLVVSAQQAKLDTALKSKLKIYNAPDSNTYAAIYHNKPTPWIINSRLKITTRKLILNVNHIQEFNIEKPNLLVQYKIDSVEIMNVPQLVKKYCGLALEKEKLLFKIDEEFLRQPDNVHIAIDAIKAIQIDNSDNYPSLKLAPKNNFKIIDIKIYKLGEKEDNGVPSVILR